MGTQGREGLSVDVAGLTKDFGSTRALDDLSFTVRPGVVTGFLGPNGSGKTTTLRCLLGLVTPDTGTATIGGRAYRDLDRPVATVGAALESAGFHPGRTARRHLEWLAMAAGLPRTRADELLAMVGLTEAGDRRVGGFSLGMRQRLALAQAMLADPSVLLLDEPANGLDPAGIAWLRQFLRALADQGRTVLISSHVLSEVQQSVDDVVVISRGRLVHQGSLAGLGAGTSVRVRTPDPDGLRAALASYDVTPLPDGAWRVTGPTAAEVGHRAHEARVELHELTPAQDGLEHVFLAMTGEAAGVEPAAGPTAPPSAPPTDPPTVQPTAEGESR